jgi:alkylhydroperoxidase family enzyme
VTETELEALHDPAAWDGVFDERTRAVLRLTDAVCGADTDRLDPGLVAELRSQLTEDELAELLLVAGQANLNNRAGNAAKQLLGPPPASDGP